MSAPLALVLGCVGVSALIRIAGPVAFGGRSMPVWFNKVVALMAPALLAALVVTEVLADSQQLTAGADTVGVAVGGLVAWRTSSVVGAVAAAAATTALLRALGA